MKADDYKAMLANASADTKRLNGEALAAGVSAAKPEQATVPQPIRGDANQARGTSRRRVCITVARCRLLEPDNAVGGVKFIVDALRYGGIIADDTGEHIQLEVRQVKVSQKCKQGTLIEVTPF